MLKIFFAVPKKLAKHLKIKIFILFYYWAALWEYWLSPKGWRGGVASRLQELPATAARQAAAEPPRIALFVGFTEYLTLSNRAYLDTLIEAGYAVLYISNCPLRPQARQALGALAWRLFERHNLGRDVGAFRDGVLWLEEQGWLAKIETLIIANDSMQFLPGNYARSLVEELNAFESSHDVGLFSHISQSHDTHYQSYFQALKKSIFQSPEFLRFWHKYLPLSHRGHCIFAGEIALSSHVYRRFMQVRVLYSSSALHGALEKLLNEGRGLSGQAVLRLMPSPARTVQRRKVGYSLDQILGQGDVVEPLPSWKLFCLADVIENNNPSHVAAFLYPLYLQCPLVKQDLCVAGSFTIAQAISLFREALLNSVGAGDTSIDVEAHVKEYADVLYAKGTPLSYINKPRESALKGITGGFVYSATYDGNL
ncbi:MAG: rhamnan synthesis F family protein [Synechococcaceae cyanobacterium]